MGSGGFLHVLQAGDSAHWGKMGTGRSPMVPLVKDLKSIIFPGSQKALSGCWKSTLVLWSLGKSTVGVSYVKSHEIAKW